MNLSVVLSDELVRTSCSLVCKFVNLREENEFHSVRSSWTSNIVEFFLAQHSDINMYL
jgi:hypothetical protein